MANERSEPLHLQPRRDFVPRQAGRVSRYTLRPRSMHSRILAKRPGSMHIRAVDPEMCPMCHTPKEDSAPVEVERDGKWWWHCLVPGCEHYWDPI